jgi:quercetin dioxygenase-like cupin family protein
VRAAGNYALRRVNDRARTLDLLPPVAGSELALSRVELDLDSATVIADPERDSLLYVVRGTGTFTLAGEIRSISDQTAMLVLAGEEATVQTSAGLELLRATVGPGADRHAPLGPRETVARLDDGGAQPATGDRSFQVLFGPYNGSTRATLFAGDVPPGEAPWHYHLYDELVWIPEGPGRLHVGDDVTELGRGSAFRLRPRQVHIVENVGTDRDMRLIGVFTPAGSPAAAYLSPEVAVEYRLAG